MLKHFFLPHPDTHKKAHLLSWQALIIYILLFILLQTSFSLLSQYQPGILGVSSNITKDQIINLTNAQRAKHNLPALSENSALDQAAAAKAANMFAEDYWAHFAPSGKTPWQFISGSGYKYTFAGENLARNFYNSDEVVEAWMNSPTHKENIVSSKYKEIGIAVIGGVLKGQKTTLVVQLFGTPAPSAVADATDKVNAPAITTFSQPSPTTVTTTPAPTIKAIAGTKTLAQAPFESQSNSVNSFNIDQYAFFKGFGFGLLIMIGVLIILDIVVMRKRMVFRITSHHMPHLAMLSVAALALYNSTPGSIL